MRAADQLFEEIHFRAVEISGRYKRAEAELISVLQQVDEHQVFLMRGHSSLFSYVTHELGLSESIAYSLITVARKAREVPELRTHLEAGSITMSNARRVAAVLRSDQPEENLEWLKKASELSNRQLEKEIVKVHPQAAPFERASYVTPERMKLEIGLSEREMLRLRRVQDLLSQARKHAVSLEETIEALTSDFIRRHDPVEKAKRHQVRNGANIGENVEATDEERRAEGNTEKGKLGTAARSAEKEILRNVGSGTEKGKLGNVGNVSENEDPATSDEGAGRTLTSCPNDQVGELVTLRVAHRRETIPAALLHQVNLRDERRCTHRFPDGTRCNQSRWIEIHHRIPVSEGGSNTLENLITWCSAHHRYWHM